MSDLRTQIISTIGTRGLKIDEVARMAGLNRSIVQRFVKGERGMTLDSAAQITTALGLELAPIGGSRKVATRKVVKAGQGRPGD
jgi:DNA-binding phage protein